MNIKNIIFDLGGVILNLDFQLTVSAFHRLGAVGFTSDFIRNAKCSFLADYETGKITSEEFRQKTCDYLEVTLSEQEFDTAWNAMLLNMPQERLDFLVRLASNYRLFLFSNTNAIHLQCLIQQVKSQLPDRLFDCFEQEYYSHLFGIRKPDPKGFLTILEQNQLDPHKTLFVDDYEENVLSAARLGLQTLYLEPAKTLFDVKNFIPA